MNRAVAPLALLVLVLPAFGWAVAATHALTWPYDVDFLREMAQAQVFADGAWTSEAFYLGEKAWYPPLGPALVAALARLTRWPVPVIYARVGAFVNLFAPILLFSFARRLFGRGVALIAVFDYIYLRPAWVPGWAAGTYSPWLFSGTFAQVLFLGGLVTYASAVERPSRLGDVVAGLFLAGAVLAHASAGLLLIVILLGASILQLRDESSARASVLAHHVTIAVAGLAFAAPYVVLLAAHYWHGIANSVPAYWIWSGLREWRDVAAQATWSLALAPVGLVLLTFRQRRALGARLTLLWVGASVGLLLLSLRLPLVPAHHLIAYIRLGLSVAIGVGAAGIGAWAMRRAGAGDRVRRWSTFGAALLALACVLPSYPRRRDLWQGKLLSERQADRPNQLAAYAWLRVNGRPTDVILASDEFAMAVVGPAGRKVVAVPSLWASPFVDNERRRRDRDLMLAALQQGDRDGFCVLAASYRVTHLMRARREGPGPTGAALATLRRVFDNNKIAVFEVHGCTDRR